MRGEHVIANQRYDFILGHNRFLRTRLHLKCKPPLLPFAAPRRASAARGVAGEGFAGEGDGESLSSGARTRASRASARARVFADVGLLPASASHACSRPRRPGAPAQRFRAFEPERGGEPREQPAQRPAQAAPAAGVPRRREGRRKGGQQAVLRGADGSHRYVPPGAAAAEEGREGGGAAPSARVPAAEADGWAELAGAGQERAAQRQQDGRAGPLRGGAAPHGERAPPAGVGRDGVGRRQRDVRAAALLPRLRDGEREQLRGARLGPHGGARGAHRAREGAVRERARLLPDADRARVAGDAAGLPRQ